MATLICFLTNKIKYQASLGYLVQQLLESADDLRPQFNLISDNLRHRDERISMHIAVCYVLAHLLDDFLITQIWSHLLV